SNSPLDIVDFPDTVRVGIYRDHYSFFQGIRYMQPVHIQPERISVDLNNDMICRAGINNLFKVHWITRPDQELSSCHMAKDGGVRILYCLYQTFGGFFLVHLEQLEYGNDHKVEAPEEIRFIVKFS